METEIKQSIAGSHLTRVVIAHRPEIIAAGGRIIKLEKISTTTMQA